MHISCKEKAVKKKLYFGSNLKMYKTISETVDYLHKLVENTKGISREEIELFIIPSYTALEAAAREVNQGFVKLGAQNMCWEDEGQFTGEISPVMLKELGIELVMIGHSERRHVFGETDYVVNRKIKAGLAHGFTTLLCVGETKQQKEFGISAEILKTQLKIGLNGVELEHLSDIWIAYEPVWSIGVNGIPASAAYAEQMHKIIKRTIVEIWGKTAAQIPVLYGGSVNSGNANQLIAQPSIDGLFVGRSAWDADAFGRLIGAARAGLKTGF